MDLSVYDYLSELDALKINFSASGMHVINIILAFVMFGVALGIKPATFKTILAKPKSVLVGLFSQLVALPALTFLVICLLKNQLTPMVAMGMILVAACPGGNISNFISQLSNANIELSVSLTAISTILSVVLTPANFALWGGLYVNYVNPEAIGALRELHINIWQMMETVFLLLGVPLALGMLTARYFPKIANNMKQPLQVLSIVFFIIMVVLSFANNMALFVRYIGFVFVVVLIHNALALGTGFALGTVFKLPEADRRTLTIETGIQNSGLGLVLLFNVKIFPPELQIGGMLFVTAWWGIWHIVSGLTVATIFNLKKI